MIELINNFVWSIAIICIFFSGIYFTFKYKFVQFHFSRMYRAMFNANKNSKDGVSVIQSFLMTLGSRIGVGSIAGIALALYIGGIGSLFWIWLSAFISAPTTFAETVLGMIYREKDGKGYKGGPSYYIKNGLNNYKLGLVYSVLILVSYVGGFVGIQGNTITKAITNLINISPVLIGIILVLLSLTIIVGGLNKIASFSEKFVPIMTIGYIIVALYIGIKNINILPSCFLNVFRDAFSIKSSIGGFFGTMIIGIQRGIFSNESGLGTGSITSSTACINDSISQGYVQTVGVYVTTILICTSTAIIVSTSDYAYLILNDANGIEIALHAFQYHLGSLGAPVLFISILFFSFSTILTGYYDGESSLKYIFKKTSNKYIVVLKITSMLVLFIGCIIPSEKMWAILDLLVALLAIINIYSLICLKNDVLLEIKCYNQKKCGKIHKR